MAKTPLTQVFVRNQPAPTPGQPKYRVYDDTIPGFALEISTSGRKTYWLRYTDQRHRRREIKIGRHGDVTTHQARVRAQELRASICLGGDPAGTRDRANAVPTFAAFLTERYLPHVRATLRAHADYEAMCRLRLMPALGRRALDEITAADVTRLRGRMMAEGLSNARVNRHLAVLRRSLGLALRWGLYQGRNPAASPGMLPEQHRERFLTEAELRALVAALGEDPDRTAAAAILLLALTGARRTEVMHARWQHLDLERRELVVPLSKSGRLRRIPLNEAALALVAGLPRPAGHAYLFPSARRPGQPIQSLRAAWGRAKLAASLPADLRLHDLRHSFASFLVNAGWHLYEIGQILGHSQLATTTRYAHLRPDRLLEAANTTGQIAFGGPVPRALPGMPTLSETQLQETGPC